MLGPVDVDPEHTLLCCYPCLLWSAGLARIRSFPDRIGRVAPLLGKLLSLLLVLGECTCSTVDVVGPAGPWSCMPSMSWLQLASLLL